MAIAFIGPVFRFGIGYALPPGRSMRTNWKERVGWGLITLGLTSGWFLKPVEAQIVRGAPWLIRTAWAGGKIAAADTAIMARAFATTQTGAAVGSAATIVAAVGVGYTVGAVTGTVIISQAEKKEIVYEGATADVLDFYTGEGQYWAQGADDPTPGYFNIPGNASLIAKHYWNKWL